MSRSLVFHSRTAVKLQHLNFPFQKLLNGSLFSGPLFLSSLGQQHLHYKKYTDNSNTRTTKNHSSEKVLITTMLVVYISYALLC